MSKAQNWFQNRTAVLATMHGKEQAIAPILKAELDLKVIIPEHFDTDRFGTFTREIPRVGDQLEAARRKALEAIAQTGLDLAIASEGSFAPHPNLPLLPCDREIIVLIDRLNKLEIIGEFISIETNFNHRIISTLDEADQFAIQVGFPEHKLIILLNKNEPIVKGIANYDQLHEAVTLALARSTTGTIQIETDMRAMHNPTRMKAIAQATHDLVQKAKQFCPSCSRPGFGISARKSGLPCGWCGMPTELTIAHLYRCQTCNFEQERYLDPVQTADPMYCPRCNP